MKLPKIIYIILLPIAIISCKTTAQPIVYDESVYDLIREIDVISKMLLHNELEKSEVRIEKALSLYEENTEILTLKCFLLIAQKKILEAKKLAHSTLDISSENGLLHVALAQIAQIEGDSKMTLEYLDKSIDISPNLSFPWYKKGLILFSIKDYENALECFKTAQKQDIPNMQISFFQYLCKLQISKNLDMYKDEWSRILDSLIKIPALYYTFHATTLYDIGYKEDAQKIISEGLKTHPDDLYLLNADIFFHLERMVNTKSIDNEYLSSIEESILNIIDKIPSAQTYDTLLNYLWLKKDYTLFDVQFKKMIFLYPDSPEVEVWSNLHSKISDLK